MSRTYMRFSAKEALRKAAVDRNRLRIAVATLREENQELRAEIMTLRNPKLFLERRKEAR